MVLLAKDSHDKTLQNRLFLKPLLSNGKRIFSYILTSVPNIADAEEIMLGGADPQKGLAPRTKTIQENEEGRVDRQTTLTLIV